MLGRRRRRRCHKLARPSIRPPDPVVCNCCRRRPRSSSPASMIAAAGPSDGPEKQQQQNRQLQLYHKPWTTKLTKRIVVAMVDNNSNNTPTWSPSPKNATLSPPRPLSKRQTLSNSVAEDSSESDPSSSIRY